MIWRLQYPPYLITFLETEQKNRGYFKTASIFLSGIFEDTDLAMLVHLEYLSLPWESPSVGLRRPCVFSKKRKEETILVPSSFFAEREGFASEIYFRVSFEVCRDKSPRPWVEKALCLLQKKKRRSHYWFLLLFCGERGSRTYAFKKYHKIANH